MSDPAPAAPDSDARVPSADDFPPATRLRARFVEWALWTAVALLAAGAVLAVRPWDHASAANGGAAVGTWQERLDQQFDAWLVQPMQSVVFHTLGTQTWLTGTPEKPGAGLPLIVVWMFLGGIFFTLRMNFINFRAFGHALRLTRGDYDRARDPGEVSHFQALASALSGTVGLGNIAGVALAVGLGGPGAVFWIVVAGLFGMSSKFAECSLGMLYRRRDAQGRIAGGPMIYLRDGLAALAARIQSAGGSGADEHPSTRAAFLLGLGRVCAVLFAVMCIGGSFGGGCTFQVSQSLNAVREDIPILKTAPWLYGTALVLLVGAVIVGGIKRIGAASERIVPFMCGLYLFCCGWVLLANFEKIPMALLVIVYSAFSPGAVHGGFWGVLIIGVRRASFSNEAGVGSASIAHSAAKTEEPISEGLVALLEPFIDTVVICACTGLVMVITGVCDTEGAGGLVKAGQGAALTRLALAPYSPFLPGLFPLLLSIVVFLFAYSTMLSWSYYGERCSVILFGAWASLPYKLVFLGFVFLGSIVSESKIVEFSDLMILSMALPNILGAALLSGEVRARLDDYWERLRTGKIRPAAEAP